MSESFSFSAPEHPEGRPGGVIPPSAGDGARPPAPPSGAALRRLAQSGALSAEALEAALRSLGVRPGPGEWAVFWRHALALCGALALACGVICFIAWNWADMHHYAKFGLLQGLICGGALLALWRGLDTLTGRMLLLGAGILIGPLLAVYGQVYMTGADSWELFRAWALPLLPLAAAGRQTGLWFMVWLTGTMWGLSYLGRLDLLRLPFLLLYPEFILAQAAFVLAWEGAARRLGAGQPWLGARWLPRLALFVALGCLTVSVCALIFLSGGRYGWRHEYGALFLPADPVNYVLYAAALAGIWLWYRRRGADLFMLGCGVLSVDAVLVTLLLKARFMIYGDVSSLLAWGLIISGLTAASGKLLRLWQRDMESETAARGGGLPEAPGFFALLRPSVSWGDIWAHLRGLNLLPQDGPPPLAAPAGAPWYVRTLQAFGGWIASLLLMAFMLLFLEMTLHLRRDFEGPLLIGGLIMLGLGAFALRGKGVTARQFGLSSALAGAGAASVALGIMARHSSLWPFAAALGALLGYPFVRSAAFRGLAAVAGCLLLALGLQSLLWGNVLDWSRRARHGALFALDPTLKRLLMTAWWAALCLGLAWFWAGEKRWSASREKSALLAPLLHGVYAALMIYLVLALMAPYAERTLAVMLSARDLGLASGLGIALFAFLLTNDLPLAAPSRAACLVAAGLTLVCGWFLPGVPLALYGLALGRHTGNKLVLGGTGTFLFAYAGYYYYNLATSLLHKSLTLMAVGAGLLALAHVLPKMLDGERAMTPGGAHA